VTAVEIAAIRHACGLSQSQLARRLGVSLRAVQMWEQGLRRPGGPAVLMLEVLRDTPVSREKRRKPSGMRKGSRNCS
jgi:putative transcriptional regulator